MFRPDRDLEPGSSLFERLHILTLTTLNSAKYEERIIFK